MQSKWADHSPQTKSAIQTANFVLQEAYINSKWNRFAYAGHLSL